MYGLECPMKPLIAIISDSFRPFGCALFYPILGRAAFAMFANLSLTFESLPCYFSQT